MEEILTRKVTGAIMGFKAGNKTAKDVQGLLDQLNKANPLLAEDYEKKYVAAARSRVAA